MTSGLQRVMPMLTSLWLRRGMSSTRMISASMYRSWREAARSNHRVGHHQGGWQGAATAALALGPADRRGLSTQSASDRAGNYKDGKGGVAPGAKLREEKSKQGGATSAPDAKAREQAPTASSSGKMGAGGKPTSAHGVPKKHENRGEKGPVQKFQRLRDISDIDGADQFKRNKSIMAHQNLVELTEECAMEGMLYSAVNVSAAMGMIGKLSQRSKIRSLKDQDALARAVRVLGRRAVEIMDTFTPRQINAMYGTYAKLDKFGLKASEQVVDAMRARAIACANGFEAMHVSHTMWALSSLVPQGGEQQLVVALCQRALTTMDNFKAMELPSMLVGIARLGVTNETLVEGLATQAALHAKDMGAQGLSNTLWSFAKLGYNPGGETIQAISDVALTKMGDFSAQNISNFVWSLGKFRWRPSRVLISKLADRIVVCQATFTPQAISNTLSGYAAFEALPGMDALKALGQQTNETITGFSAQAVCTSLSSLAKLRVLGASQENKFWSMLSRRAQATCSDMTLKGISGLLEAMQQSPTLPRENVVEQLLERVAELTDDFDALTIPSFLRGVRAVRAIVPEEVLVDIYGRAMVIYWSVEDADACLEAMAELRLSPPDEVRERLRMAADGERLPKVAA